MGLEVVLNLHHPNVPLPATHPDSLDEPFAAFGDKVHGDKADGERAGGDKVAGDRREGSTF